MMAKQQSDMVQCMVANLHTTLKVHHNVQHGWNMIYTFAWRWQLEKTVYGQRVTLGSMSPAFLAQA